MTHEVTLEECHRGFSQPLPNTFLSSPLSPLCSEALLTEESFPDHPICHCTLHSHTPTPLPCLIVFHSLSFYDTNVKVTQSCPTLCDPMNHSMPGLPVHHQLQEFTQTHAHQVSDAIQSSRPLSSPSPPAFSHPQHLGLFQ